MIKKIIEDWNKKMSNYEVNVDIDSRKRALKDGGIVYNASGSFDSSGRGN
jgi:hypothetical protein